MSNASLETDKAEILRLMKEWSQAVESKDVDAIVKDYAPDVVLFDAIPPYKKVGIDGVRSVWEGCLPYFPDDFKSEHRDVNIQLDGDVAFVNCVHHFVPAQSDHPCGQTWMRVTVGYRKIDGNWKVVHEHVSIPFNPMDGQAWHVKDPEANDSPNYGH